MTSGGRFDFDDGGTYCGSWEDGKALGYGVCTGPKGQGAYYGAYHNGFEICGVYKWTTGSAYKGQWTQGKRHGLGVESKGRWVYQGEWTQGFKGRYGSRQSSSTGAKYEGTWTTGLQDGYGVETYADGGTYSGQWLRGIRHGYGVRRSVPYGIATLSRQKAGRESLTSLRSENEEDQIVKERDRRMEEIRGGFVLSSKRSTSEVRTPGKRSDDRSSQRRSNSAEPTKSKAKTTLRRAFEGLRLRKQRSEELDNEANLSNSPSSTGERRRFTSGSGSARSWLRRKNDYDDSGNKSNTSSSYASSMRYSPISAITSESCASFNQDDGADASDIETYSGEWKNDKRSGFGVAERTDGLKYEGEWDNNKRHGYGSTTYPDGSKEEGKYKNDLLVNTGRKSKFILLRGNKLKEHVDNAIVAAQRASQIAVQKAEIAINRMGTARAKAELAMQSAEKAQSDAEKARLKAIEYAPDFMAELEKKSAAVPLLGLPQLQSSKGGPHHHHDSSHSHPIDAAVSFVSQFTDHYNPQNQFQNAKSFLNRVTKATSGATDLTAGVDEAKLPLPSIGNALLSAGLESGLLKSLAQKPMQPTSRHGLTSQNISNGSSANKIEPGRSPINSNISSTQQQTSSSNKSSDRSQKETNRRRLQDFDMSTTVATAPLLKNISSDRKAPNQNDPNPIDNSRFSHVINQSVLDDHFDQYQTREEATKVTPSTANPTTLQSSNPSSAPTANPPLKRQENVIGSPWEMYQHQHQQLQQQLQHQQEFLHQQQQQILLQHQHNQFSSERPFSYDNPSGRPGQIPDYDQMEPRPYHPYDQAFTPTPFSYERRQTLPPGQLEQIVKASFLQQPNVPNRQKEAPPVVQRSTASRAAKDAMGSMPDVSKRKTKGANEEPAMPREEVHVMSMRRREEIRKLREEEERRRQQELVLSFGEFRNWCHQRQLLVFLIAINLGLAAVFFNLLSR